MTAYNVFSRMPAYKKLIVSISTGIFLLFISHNSFATTVVKEQPRHKGLLPSPVRALHLVSKGVSPNDMKRLIDKAVEARFNVIILGIGWRDSTKLNSMPWVTDENAWSREQLVNVVNYARKKKIEVVPQILLLSHQDKFLGKTHAALLYNPKTYDPRNPKVYELVFKVLDEVIDLIHPEAIHIGHDELFGSPNRPKHWKTGEQLLPAELFLLDVQRIHDHLQTRDVQTWMWGDMLIAQDEFPKASSVYHLGGVPGYGASLRKQLPKDIVICDWHYSGGVGEFGSVDAFKRDGFRVLGATFENENTIRNFSGYASSHGADGMVATVWFYTFDKRKEPIVDRIIKISGQHFLKDFPDER